MHSKTESQKTTPQTSPAPQTESPTSFINSTYYRYLWDGANFATVALATSAGVVAIQSPLKTMLVSIAKNNVVIPAYKGGFLGCVRMLYTGTQASLGSNSIRAAYATSTKSSRPTETFKEEVGKEEAYTEGHSIGYIASAAFGEVAVSQVPVSIVDYRKANILPPNFKWWTPYNFAQLLKGNFAVKCVNSGVNFYALCVIEPKYADCLSFLPPNAARFMSGALSGMTAGVFTYPLAAFVDYTQVRAEVKDGKLINKSPVSSFTDLARIFWMSPKSSLIAFSCNAGKQIPLRMLSTGATFSVVAGFGNFLKQEPLREVVSPRFIPSAGRNPSAFFNKPLEVKQAEPEEAAKCKIT